MERAIPASLLISSIVVDSLFPIAPNSTFLAGIFLLIGFFIYYLLFIGFTSKRIRNLKQIGRYRESFSITIVSNVFAVVAVLIFWIAWGVAFGIPSKNTDFFLRFFFANFIFFLGSQCYLLPGCLYAMMD
jgi:hypothetical protein